MQRKKPFGPLVAANFYRPQTARSLISSSSSVVGQASSPAASVARLRLAGMLLVVLAFFIPGSAQPQTITGQSSVVSGRGVMNARGLQMTERAHNLNNPIRPLTGVPAPMPRADFIAITQNLTGAESPASQGNVSDSTPSTRPMPRAAALPSGGPRSATLPGFQAGVDDNTAIPPDAGGAVGPNHVMAVHNNNVVVQDRAGNILLRETLNSFWMAVDSPNVFNPKVLYDPYNDRWIFSAAANRMSDRSSILLAVSQTGDPTGNWNLFHVDADPSNVSWADYPSVGFNKDWIVVTANMFAISQNNQIIHPYFGENIYVFSKTNLYANGDGRFTLFQDTSLKGFTLTPAITYDNDVSTLYLVQVENLLHTEDIAQPHAVNRLQISAITGPVGSETLDLAVGFTPLTNEWLTADSFFSSFFFLSGSGPQLGSFLGIDLGDTRLQDVVYRNGSLWTTHTIFEPADSSSTLPFHSAVQWWQLTPTGEVQQLGRVEDPSGNVSYAYPSIAVNRCNDVMIGYNRFAFDQYASAYYSFRFGTDTPSSLQPP